MSNLVLSFKYFYTKIHMPTTLNTIYLLSEICKGFLKFCSTVKITILNIFSNNFDSKVDKKIELDKKTVIGFISGWNI